MRFKTVYLIVPILALVSLALLGYRSNDATPHFDERVKVALRDAGNRLLLVNQDSTSRVMPVVTVGESRYELSFETDIFLEPGSLVKVIDKSLAAANLPSNYITEVRECATREVAYSYQNSQSITEQIVPCSGRELPLNCYTIQVLFTKPNDAFLAHKNYPLYSLILVGFIGVGLVYKSKSKKTNTVSDSDEHPFISIGRLQFYKEQHQLVHDENVMNLTTKECELLTIFCEQPNAIVRRDYLIKTVWEDQGVFVGRSLDTYISKIRKKLAVDGTVNLTTVHGVGYKLEIVD